MVIYSLGSLRLVLLPLSFLLPHRPSLQVDPLHQLSAQVILLHTLLVAMLLQVQVPLEYTTYWQVRFPITLILTWFLLNK
jgi:hypothetical protein